MASPVVEGVAESSVNTAGTSHTVTLPAGGASTDLFLITMDIGSTSATLDALTDWTEDLDEAVSNGLKIIRYTGTGVPSDPTFTSSASTRSASIAWRISGADKTVAPDIGTTATGTSATPNPPQVSAPSGTKDCLYIAFYGAAGEEADDDTWSDTPPTDFTPTPPYQKACGTAGTNLGGMIAAAYRQLTTGAVQNPGTFAKDTSAAWRAQTIRIDPEPGPVSGSGGFTSPAPVLAGTGKGPWTVTARHSGNNATTSSQTLTTNSVTPTANSLLLAAFGAQSENHFTQAAAQTPTGGSLTYTVIQTDGQGADLIPWGSATAYNLSGGLYRAPVGSSPSAFAITFDAWSTTNVGFYNGLSCDITGHDAANPVVQSASNGTVEGEGNAETSTVTLGATPTAGNLIVVFATAGADSGGGFTSPTMGSGKTFTQLHNQSSSFTQGGMWYRIADGGEDTTVTISDLGQAVGHAILMAVEIAVATGGGPVSGTGALTSPAPVLAGEGDVPRTGSGALATAAPTLSGSGDVLVQGTGAATSPAGVLAGTGTVAWAPITGTGALTSPAGVLAGSGDVLVQGAGAATSPASVLAASGDVLVQGSGAPTSPAGVLAGSGAVTNGPTGTGALTSPPPVLAGSGDVLIQGSGAPTSPAAVLAGSGDVLIAGSGAPIAPASVLSGSGTVSSGATGTGALTSPQPVLAGSGDVLVQGTGALTSPRPLLSGSGTVVNGPNGPGALTSPRPVLAGLGKVLISGVGALVSPAGVLSGYKQAPAWTFSPPFRGAHLPHWIRGISDPRAEVPFGRFTPSIKRYPNVFLLLDGSLTETQPDSWEQVSKVYYGGHVAVIEDLAEHDALVAAGYDLEVYIP